MCWSWTFEPEAAWGMLTAMSHWRIAKLESKLTNRSTDGCLPWMKVTCSRCRTAYMVSYILSYYSTDVSMFLIVQLGQFFRMPKPTFKETRWHFYSLGLLSSSLSPWASLKSGLFAYLHSFR